MKETRVWHLWVVCSGGVRKKRGSSLRYGVRLTVGECVKLVVGYQLVQYLERRMIYGGGEDLLQVVAKSAAYLAD